MNVKIIGIFQKLAIFETFDTSLGITDPEVFQKCFKNVSKKNKIANCLETNQLNVSKSI